MYLKDIGGATTLSRSTTSTFPFDGKVSDQPKNSLTVTSCIHPCALLSVEWMQSINYQVLARCSIDSPPRSCRRLSRPSVLLIAVESLYQFLLCGVCCFRRSSSIHHHILYDQPSLPIGPCPYSSFRRPLNSGLIAWICSPNTNPGG